MDNEYIRMCRAATELQEAWQPKDGDKIYQIYSEKDKKFSEENWPDSEDHNGGISHIYNVQFLNAGSNDYTKYLKRGDKVWLPCQEDIQKLYKKKCKVAYDGDVYLVFNDWVKKSLKHCDLSFNEMWLCFYMETCHNKTWYSGEGVWKVKP